jgi:hypothetical protein
MSSSAPELHAIADGLSLRLVSPDGAREVPDETLPAIDVSAIAGARVALRRGVDADGLSLRAVCATAPSRTWAPGVEELVLDRASGLVRGALGVPITRWDAGPIGAASHRFDQGFEGAGGLDGHPVAIRGRHVLGFVGRDHDAALCSVVCLEPARAPRARCAALVDAAHLEGALVAPPEPSLLVRSILLAAEQPLAAAATFALIASAGVALVLWRRPRPCP